MNDISKIQAQIMSLEKDNVHGITLYGLVFSENGKESIVLRYGLYHENDNSWDLRIKKLM